jgi:membrane-associated phospholipid phosphatase
MGTDSATAVLLAQWAGRHALLLFIVILVGSLALTFAVARAWQHPAGPTVPTQASLTGRFRRQMALGLGVMSVGSAVIAVLAGHLGADDGLSQVDHAFTESLRLGVPQPALQVFAVLTHLGDTVTLTTLGVSVALALILVQRPGLAVGWVVAVAGNGILNDTLKHTIGRMRPLFTDGGWVANGYSFPSGHSSGSVVAYGMLAYLALRLLPAHWHLPAMMLSVALAVTVGASRLFLRVHFGSDVVAGVALGAAWLAACVTFIELRSWKGQLAGRCRRGTTPERAQ